MVEVCRGDDGQRKVAMSRTWCVQDSMEVIETEDTMERSVGSEVQQEIEDNIPH